MVKSKSSKINKKKVHMKEDKVDLSSVNKKNNISNSRTVSSIKTVFQKKSDKNRDELGKFTAGSGGLKKLKSFNIKRALPLIAVIALVGGLFVYQSFATSSADRVTRWYQVCRGTTSTGFGGTQHWASQLDSGSASYATFRDTMRANKDGNCPDSEPSMPSSTPTPAPVTPAPSAPSSASQASVNKVTSWYQVCRGSSSKTFSGTQFWASQVDNGTANYVKFRDTMRANKDGNCPDNDPTGSASPTSPTPPSSGNMPAKKYHQGRSASPDCFSDSNCATVVRELYKTLLARDPGPSSSGIKDYASKMLDWGWTRDQVSQNIKQTPEYKNRQTLVQNNIMDYDPKVTDFMDTRSFLWFAYERICYSGTRSAVNYWTKEIDSGRWTRKAFWEHLQSQQCAENVANNRLYDSTDQNLTEDGKQAKGINKELNVAYWEVFLKMWDEGGWKDWDGVHKPGWMWVLDSGDKHLATQMACEQIVWKYRNGIPVGLDDTCFNLVTGMNKPIHSQDIMYGDYFGDKVTLEEGLERIRAVQNGDDQSVSCQSAKAQLLPGCDTGAKYVPIADLEKVIEEREKQEKASSTKPGTTSPQQSKNDSDTSSSKDSKSAASNNNTMGQVSDLKRSLEIENSLMSAIVYPECDEITALIEPDHRGTCVEYVQNAMALLVDPNIRVSGLFDKSTEDHLLGFQISRNVPISEQGKIGVKTYSLLKKALEPRVMKSPYAPPRGMFVNNR